MKRVLIFLGLFLCIANSFRLLKPDNPKVSYYIDDDGRMISNLQPMKVEGNQVRFIEESAPKSKNKKSVIPKRYKKAKSQSQTKILSEHNKGCSCVSEGYILNGYKYSQKCFMKSTCLPVVMIPGILGTRLTIRYKGTKILSVYGDRTKIGQCFSGYLSDDQERTLALWISTDYSSHWAIEIMSSSEKPFCFGLLASKLEATLQKDGFEIYVDENNLNSFKSEVQCGLDTISYLAGRKINSIPGSGIEPVGYGYLADYLRKMGYKSNVNMFGLGYDWRKKPGDNEVFGRLADILKQSWEINKKKAIVITHSYGSLNTLHFINEIRTKDGYSDFDPAQYIERWVPVGGPLGGATALLEGMVGNYNPLEGKIARESYAYIARTLPGVWALLPKAIGKDGENSDFIEKFNERYKCEKESNCGETIPFSFWPKTRKFSDLIRNYFTDPYAVIENEDGTVFKNILRVNEQGQETEFIDFLKQYLMKSDLLYNEKTFLQSEVDKIIEIVDKDSLNKLINPEVPITCVFMGNKKMLGAVRIDKSKDIIYEENEFNVQQRFPPKEISKNVWDSKAITTLGDESVTTFSSLIPTLKFAFDYENDQGKHKPVQFVEMTPQSQYTGNTWTNENTNSYSSLQCNDKTVHSTMVADTNFIYFIASMALSGSQVAETTVDQEKFQSISDNCLNYRDTYNYLHPESQQDGRRRKKDKKKKHSK